MHLSICYNGTFDRLYLVPPLSPHSFIHFNYDTRVYVCGKSMLPVIFARLAQSVEHETLNLRVVGSSPTLGVLLVTKCAFFTFFKYLK